MSDPLVLILDSTTLAAMGDAFAARLLQTTNGSQTVAQELQHLDADVSTAGQSGVIVGP